MVPKCTDNEGLTVITWLNIKDCLLHRDRKMEAWHIQFVRNKCFQSHHTRYLSFLQFCEAFKVHKLEIIIERSNQTCAHFVFSYPRLVCRMLHSKWVKPSAVWVILVLRKVYKVWVEQRTGWHRIHHCSTSGSGSLATETTRSWHDLKKRYDYQWNHDK